MKETDLNSLDNESLEELLAIFQGMDDVLKEEIRSGENE